MTLPPYATYWAFLDAVTRAESMVGSADHKGFALACLKWRDQRSSAQFTFDTMDLLLKTFKARKNIPQALAVSTMRDMTPFIVGSATWAELGFPSITLTHDFYRAIAVTDFGDAGDDPAYMPFPSFVLRLPEGLKGEEGACPLFMLPVATYHDPTGKAGRPGHYVSGLERALGPDEIEFGATRLVIQQAELKKQGFTQWANGVPCNFLVNMPGVDLNEIDPLEGAVSSAYGQELDRDATRRARRVLVNTLLYINANGGLPVEKKVGPDVHVEREHKTEPRFRVGRPIKLGAKLKGAIREGLRGGVAWKLDSRFVVRGHWRNQAYGPQMSLRRRRWIEPYWKGPEDMGEALERTFEVT